MLSLRSSHRRYLIYRQKVRERNARKGGSGDAAAQAVLPMGQRRSRDHHRSFLALFMAFLGLLGGFRRTMILAIALLTVSTLVGLVPPYLTKLAIDQAIGGQPMPSWLASYVPFQGQAVSLLLLLAGFFFFCHIAHSLIDLYSRWQVTRINQRLNVKVRRLAFEHAVRLPLVRLQAAKSGGMTSVIREDAGAVGQLIFSLLYNPWRGITQLVGVLVILALVDWRILLGAVILLPIVYLTHSSWISRIRPLWRDVRATREHIDGQVTETFGGIRVVRTFGRQRTEATTFTSNSHLMSRQELFGWWMSRTIDLVWQLLIPAAVAGVLAYVGYAIITDQRAVQAGTLAPEQALSVGDLVMFLFYITSLLQPIAQLATSATQFQTSLAALDRILDLLREDREMASDQPTMPLDRQRVQGEVCFDAVSFAYPGSEQFAVQNIDLTLAAGETVALVGHSGSGKTTLCNLLARFYPLEHGRMLLDGQDVTRFHVEDYRRLLAIVEQDVFLFDGTVRDNIAYGARHASDVQVRLAAQQANAAEFIERLPEGYESWIGERGVKLSGGQRQRIAIARAILADPRILILDEATSSLDSHSERLIQESLRELMQGRTSLIIAHRLSTIRHADRIVVLQQGQIMETGTHDALMARSGLYREMVQLQLQPQDHIIVPAATDDFDAVASGQRSTI